LFFIPDYKDWAFQKLLGAIILGSVFQLIVLLTKEKGLGQGDVRLAIISGILVGMDNLILWLYVTIFSALIYGLFLAKKKKKFKGLKIPFVPFMVLGMVVILLILI
ncbi:MAG TPA: prepilin peptidase, partial [Candidatus Dojkabacteria bacterium]|nr:prepilin peptidase [Candidatus Dojkabacteria bacterium]